MEVILGAVLAISVYGGINFYVGKRLHQYISFIFPKANGIVFAVVYILLALTILLSFMPLPIIVKKTVRFIGAYWLGFFVYFLIFFLLSDLAVLLGNAIKLIPSHMLQNVQFYAKTAAILLTIGVVCYGLYNANQLKIVSYEVQLKRSLAGDINIVLISDLHLGDINSENRLEDIVREINSLNPDVVCIAGDIFSDDFYSIRDPEMASTLLKGIEATYGVFASLGNHDGDMAGTQSEMMDFIERSNIILLNDEYKIIDERLVLIGRLDASPIGGFKDVRRKDFSEILANTNVDLPIVVMEHNPGHIDEYGSEVDLILSGHTHRGQIFPGSLITRAVYTVDYGHYQKDSDSPNVIVTQGVHTWMMPMRVGTDNEIVNILLQ